MTKQFELPIRDLKALQMVLNLVLFDTAFLDNNPFSPQQERQCWNLQRKIRKWITEEEQNEIAA